MPDNEKKMTKNGQKCQNAEFQFKARFRFKVRLFRWFVNTVKLSVGNVAQQKMLQVADVLLSARCRFLRIFSQTLSHSLLRKEFLLESNSTECKTIKITEKVSF